MKNLFVMRSGAALVLMAASACASSVPPCSRVFAPIDPDLARKLYVSATGEREAVVASLEWAGFSVATDLRDTPLTLTVRLGGRRATRECGSVRNVVFELLHAGIRIAVIKGRGLTGSCHPNILREMSAELARLFNEPRPSGR